MPQLQAASANVAICRGEFLAPALCREALVPQTGRGGWFCPPDLHLYAAGGCEERLAPRPVIEVKDDRRTCTRRPWREYDETAEQIWPPEDRCLSSRQPRVHDESATPKAKHSQCRGVEGRRLSAGIPGCASKTPTPNPLVRARAYTHTLVAIGLRRASALRHSGLHAEVARSPCCATRSQLFQVLRPTGAQCAR